MNRRARRATDALRRKSVQVNVIIEAELADEVDGIARGEGLNRSDVVRRAILRDVRGTKREA